MYVLRRIQGGVGSGERADDGHIAFFMRQPGLSANQTVELSGVGNSFEHCVVPGDKTVEAIAQTHRVSKPSPLLGQQPVFFGYNGLLTRQHMTFISLEPPCSILCSHGGSLDQLVAGIRAAA